MASSKTLTADGTSQTGRALRALDPGYVSVDERTAEQLLSYVRAYAQGLRYFGPDNQAVDAQGNAVDWTGFLGSLSPETVAAFLSHPERFDPKDPANADLFRPHFVLFLAFLGLLAEARVDLNALTARHLDFYYRQVLRMTQRGPVPDRVNVIFSLASGEQQVLVPAGTRLAAGADSLGKDLVYATDRDVVVNRAQIGKVSSLFVDRRITRFADVRLRVSDRHAAALAMLGIALGDPNPGDALPSYSGPPYPGSAPIGPTLIFDTLKVLDDLTQYTGGAKGFYLTLPELRDLMHRRDVAAKATGAQLAEDWAEINRIIVLAGQKKNPAYQLPAGASPTDFAGNMASAVGGNVLAYWAAIQALEAYFFMSAESFDQVYQQLLSFDPSGWDPVDAILDEAHTAKVSAARKAHLQAVGAAQSAPDKRLAALIVEVMGSDKATLDDLAPFLSSPDFAVLSGDVSALDWTRAYGIFEVALRNRVGVPPAQQEEWLNLYPADDAAAAGARPALPGQDSSPRWATFGLLPALTQAVAPPPALGWAVSAPILALAEGTRTIILTLQISSVGVDVVATTKLLAPPTSPPPPPHPLRVEVSTAKGWVECAQSTVTVGAVDTNTHTFNVGIAVVLAAGADALAPSADLDSPWPTLRVMLRPLWNADAGRYVVRDRELCGLIVASARIDVSVNGLKALALQNDESALDAKKPFLPFGISPAVGSRLLVGHPEIVDRPLDSLTFDFQWMRPPADLPGWYANYNLSSGFSFTVNVSVVDRGVPSVIATSKGLFGTGKTTDAVSMSVGAVPAPSSPPGGALGDDLTTWPRYLQWELNTPDFQHAVYPAVAAAKAVQLAADIAKPPAGGVVASNYTVNPPYTPKLKALAIDYTTSRAIPLDKALRDPRVARVYHVHPFGICDVEAERTQAGVPLLPSYDNDGELYLGISGLVPPQNLTILFQLAEGSANPDLPPQTVTWSYLSADRWVDLGAGVVQDSTRGLVNSGIVELALVPAAPSSRVRGGYYWIRAAVARYTGAVCDSIALRAQAAAATFVDQGNAPDHYRDPLPAGAIKKLSSVIPRIAKVEQPYTSYGGRMAEAQGTWNTRVSERLRHRNRALSGWDHERLILDAFPQVYKAKCIPATAAAPGQVKVVIIPDIRDLLPSDPFEPKAPAGLLAEVQAYLAARMPVFASVSVKNPRYRSVRVRLGVRFSVDGNESYYAQRLNDELNRFLSPWAYDEGADITLGGRIYAASIVDFVERRPYVDFVAGLKLFASDDGVNFTEVPAPTEGEGPFVDAGQPDAVLVAARTHIINVLHDTVYQENLFTGIDFMTVELDFQVR